MNISEVKAPETRLNYFDAKALLIEIQDFCRSYRVAESTFGRLAVNDGKLIPRLQMGSKVTGRTVKKVIDYIYSKNPSMK